MTVYECVCFQIGCHLGFMHLINLTKLGGTQEPTKTFCHGDSDERVAKRCSGCAGSSKCAHGWRRCGRHFWGRCSNWGPDAHTLDSDSSEVIDLLFYDWLEKLWIFWCSRDCRSMSWFLVRHIAPVGWIAPLDSSISTGVTVSYSVASVQFYLFVYTTFALSFVLICAVDLHMQFGCSVCILLQFDFRLT